MISYLSKIVLGLLVFLYPLFSYADVAAMTKPIPLGISLAGITIIMPVVLSAVLLFMLRKKGVPLQPKQNVSLSEQHVFKISRFFLSLNLVLFVLIVLFNYNEDFLKYLRLDYLILGIISICVILMFIGFVLGLFSQGLIDAGDPTKVRLKYWAGLCLSALLTAVFYAHIFGCIKKSYGYHDACSLFTKKGIHCCWGECPFMSEEDMRWHLENPINGFDEFE